MYISGTARWSAPSGYTYTYTYICIYDSTKVFNTYAYGEHMHIYKPICIYTYPDVPQHAYMHIYTDMYVHVYYIMVVCRKDTNNDIALQNFPSACVKRHWFQPFLCTHIYVYICMHVYCTNYVQYITHVHIYAPLTTVIYIHTFHLAML